MKASDTTDDPYLLVQVRVGYYLVLSKYGNKAEGEKILTTGTYEEMKALQKLMKATHANDWVKKY